MICCTVDTIREAPVPGITKGFKIFIFDFSALADFAFNIYHSKKYTEKIPIFYFGGRAWSRLAINIPGNYLLPVLNTR